MAAPAFESPEAILHSQDAEQRRDSEDALVHAALQGYFGQDANIRNVTAFERHDYTGPASDKVRCGGALVVECAVFEAGEFAKRRLTINDANRSLGEDAITILGARAAENRLQGRYLVRDVRS